MLILHAGIADNQTVLWAEQSISDTPQARKFSYKQKLHPFAASADYLLKTLGTQSIQGISSGPQPVPMRIWLPSTSDEPMPSSRLLYPDNYVVEKPTAFSQWQIECLLVDALEIAKLGDALKINHVLSPGIIIGGEFAFLTKLLRFASSLIVNQKYLPTIVDRNGKFFACWKPIFSAEDNLFLNNLSESAPDLVRSLTPDVRLRAPDMAPLDLVVQYVEHFVDSSVRKKAFEVVKYIVMSKGTYLSAHDCWLHSLCTRTGEMNFDLEKLNAFAEQVFEWQQPLIAGDFSPFRLCFKLEAPIDPDDEASNQFPSPCWNIEYVLQDMKDPSLFISAEDAWMNSAPAQQRFARGKFRPREQLLRSLGEASRLSEQVGESLKKPNPVGFELTDSGAFDFVTEVAPALQQAGFGVLLPKWWTKGPKKGIKRIGKPSRKSSSQKVVEEGALSFNGIINFNWKIALGDVELTEEELQTLAALKTPLVKIRGQWTIVGKAEIQAAIDYLKNKVGAKMTFGDVMRLEMAKEIGADHVGVGDTKVEVEVEVPDYLGGLITQLKEPKYMLQLHKPHGFVGTLRPYQVLGFSWMYFLCKNGIGGCLADDMGLGKTIQTLALIQQFKQDKNAGPVLLICPTSVVTNWLKEAMRFTPDLSVMVHHGANRAKTVEFAKKAGRHDLVLATYGLLARDLETLKSVKWKGVILDEAQNIKNDLTRQSKASRELEARFKIALTGTPVENTVADLYSLMQFLNPNYLGGPESFKRNFQRPIQLSKDLRATALLRQLTKPLVLRRLKTDKSIITDLPDKIESREYCTLTKEQVSLYTAVIEDMIERLPTIDAHQRLGFLMTVMLRLKQVCNHPVQYNYDTSTLDGRSGKLDRLVEMVDEIMLTGEKALIFSQFVEMGTLIRKHLQDKFGEEVLFLHGQVPRKQRDQMVERFQSPNGPKLFVISLKAGGTGLNLTAASHVFHYDRWWNPAVENQATDRAFRIGQKKNVQVHKFIAHGTLEDAVDEMIESKKEMSEQIVGGGENWLADLSNAELTKMLSLSKEAYTE